MLTLGRTSAARGFGFRVSGVGFRVQGLGFRIQGLGFRVGVWGFGFRVSASGFRVGFGVSGSGLVLRVSRVRGFGVLGFKAVDPIIGLMGGCQNYGPFLGPYYNTDPSI